MVTAASGTCQPFSVSRFPLAPLPNGDRDGLARAAAEDVDLRCLTDQIARERVLQLFDESLGRRGVLALGRKETIRGTVLEDRYEPVVEAERIYRKLG